MIRKRKTASHRRLAGAIQAAITANRRLEAMPCSPSLDCSHDELVAYIHSMKEGDRVMEMGESCMKGRKGTVEIRDRGVCIRWDHAKFADGAGYLITSFTGGARIIPENAAPSRPESQQGA